MRTVPLLLLMSACSSGVAPLVTPSPRAVAACAFRPLSTDVLYARGKPAAEAQSSTPPGRERVVGIVVDRAGSPVEAALVDVRAGSFPLADTLGLRRQRTAADGTFQLDFLTDSNYVLDVRRVGYERQWHLYQGVRGTIDTLCIQLRESPFRLAPVTTG